MNILVTGGVGFIGTNLIRKLLKDGHKIISIDNYSTGKKENEQAGCKYFDFDLSNSNMPLNEMCSVEGFEKPDIIYHLGALPRIQPSFLNPTKTFDSNVKGTQNIMECARALNIPVVYAGSSSSHGDKCANPYTHSKWLGEEVVTMYNKIYDIPTAICRFYNVYGEYQLTEGAYCTVLGIFERLYGNSKPLTITGDGEQRRDFTYVGDIVDGLSKCGTSLLIPNEFHAKINGETFELGKGENYSINDVAKAFGDYPTEYIDSRLGEMRDTLNTDTKAYEKLGWKPDGDIIDYIKNNILKK
jgi:UDP-glucose 4-epimerase